MMILKVFVSILCLFLLSDQSLARILNVPEEWESIQVAVNATESGDTVLVAPGMYVGRLSIEDTSILLASWILLTNDPAYIDSTIIDGTMFGSVLRIASANDDTTFVRGFTIQHGRQTYGGGINCRPGVKARLEDLIIKDCIVTNHGGGVYISNGGAEVWLKRVKLVGNQAEYGGAIGLNYSSLHIDSCQILDNEVWGMGSAICFFSFINCTIRNTLVSGNIGNTSTIVQLPQRSEGDNLVIDHLTMCGNTDADGNGLMSINMFDTEGRLLVSNSIFWDDSERAITADIQHNRDNSDLSYCVVRHGSDGVSFGDDEAYGDGNIDEDPRFTSPDNGDYHLSWGSPCIDAGNPDSTADADGSHCEIGAFTFINQFGWLEGQVSDRSTDFPIDGAIVRVFQADDTIAVLTSDSLGKWQARLHLPDGPAQITVEARTLLYHPFVLEGVDIGLNDTIRLSLTQLPLGLMLSPDSLLIQLDPGDTIRSRFFLANADVDTIVWHGRITVPHGLLKESGELQDSINAGQLLEDSRIQGVACGGEVLFIAGANADDTNQIYVTDLNGVLLYSFNQPQQSRYGMRDLAWDGEYLWGSEDDSIFAFDEFGNIERRFLTNVDDVSCLAFDPGEGLIWASGVTSDIFAYDREGNDVGRRIDNGFRKYGLAWYPEDPDGYCLYVLHRFNNFRYVYYNYLYKINTTDGDTIFVNQVTGEFDYHSSLDITNAFDLFGGWSTIRVDARASEEGDDQVLVHCLDPFNSWFEITPSEGVLAPDDEIECQVTIRAVNSYGEPADSAHYRMEFHVSVEGDVEGEYVYPIDLYIGIVPPVTAPDDAPTVPDRFQITGIYPNPFNGQTTISFTLDKAGIVEVGVFDLSGRRVATLLQSEMDVGSHNALWKANTEASGIYLVKVAGPGGVRTSRMALVK